MEKTIQITKADILKQGTNEKSGKNWTLYIVKCSGDDEMKEFTTFDFKYKDSIGQQMRSNFQYDEKWKNWKEITAKQEEESSKHNEIMNALREIYSLIAEVNRAVVPQPEEHLKEGEPEIPIHDEPTN